MKTLRIGKGLELPPEVVVQKNAILAMSGAGKSNTAVVLAEEMHAAGLPWVAVDPKGDWWGVRSGAGGKGPGLPVPVLGGLHGDIPLDPKSGALVARLIAEKRLTCILDVSEFDSKAEQMRFLTDFATALLRYNTEPLHVFAEEADEYLPQNVLGEMARCVSAWQKLVKRGRFRGIGVTLISQRSAALNKDALNQADTLIAMRVTAPRDKAAIRDWVQGHSDSAQLLDSLPALDDGEAWVWSPQRLKIMRRVKFRRRTTFDSGETPKLGKSRPPATLADVDLGAIREEMASAIEAAQADDPKALRRRIAELERELVKVRAENVDSGDLQAWKDRASQLHMSLGDSLGLIQRTAVQFQEAGDSMRRVLLAEDSPKDASRRTTPGVRVEERFGRTPRPPTPVSPTATSTRNNSTHNRRTNLGTGALEQPKTAGRAPSGAGNISLSKCARGLLGALLQHGRLTLEQAAIIAGYAPNSGGVRNAAGELRSAGCVEGGNTSGLEATDAGRAALPDLEPLPTGPDLAAYWYGKLAKAEREILRVVVASYPGAVSLTDAAERCGYAPNSGGVRNAAGRLRTLRLVEGSNAAMTANERLV